MQNLFLSDVVTKYFNCFQKNQCCGAGAGSGCIFLASKKGKPCVLTKHDFKAVYNGKCDPKQT